MEQHCSFDVPAGVPVRTDPSGVARLTCDRRFELSASSAAEARIAQSDLLTARDQTPPALRGFVWGDRAVPGMIQVGWHGGECGLTRAPSAMLARGHSVKTS
jgi:hypothetical protein